MRKIIVILIIFVLFNCSKIIEKSDLITKTYNPIELICDTWILEKSYIEYIKSVNRYDTTKKNYNYVVITPSIKYKKINNEIAYLYNVDIQWDIRILKLIGTFPEYRLKFKYNESETIDFDGKILANWLDGEMIMHFNNENEVWFELVYPKVNNIKGDSILKNLIRYGKDNVYKREKILKDYKL